MEENKTTYVRKKIVSDVSTGVASFFLGIAMTLLTVAFFFIFTFIIAILAAIILLLLFLMIIVLLARPSRYVKIVKKPSTTEVKNEVTKDMREETQTKKTRQKNSKKE